MDLESNLHIILDLKTGTACFSETLASTYETTWHQKPRRHHHHHHHHHHHTYRSENFKPHVIKSQIRIAMSGSHKLLHTHGRLGYKGGRSMNFTTHLNLVTMSEDASSLLLCTVNLKAIQDLLVMWHVVRWDKMWEVFDSHMCPVVIFISCQKPSSHLFCQ
jgi:hypothetical protein